MAVGNIFTSHNFAAQKVVIIISLVIYLVYFDKFLGNVVNNVLKTSIESILKPVYSTNFFIKENLYVVEEYLIQNKDDAEAREGYENKIYALTEENINLKNELLSYKAYVEIIKNIQQSSKFKTMGRIISIDNQTIRINVGENKKIAINDLVINQDGVVGYITEIENFSASVRLITSEQSVMPAKSLSQNLIINGTGEMNKLLSKLKLEDEAKRFQVGDKVYTSDLGDLYTSGYLLGNISDISYNALENNFYLVIKPSSDLNSLDFIAVVGKL